MKTMHAKIAELEEVLSPQSDMEQEIDAILRGDEPLDKLPPLPDKFEYHTAAVRIVLLPEVVLVVDDFNPKYATDKVEDNPDRLVACLMDQDVIKSRRVMYRGTDGLWNEIIVERGICGGIIPHRAPDIMSALLAVHEPMGSA